MRSRGINSFYENYFPLPLYPATLDKIEAENEFYLKHNINRDIMLDALSISYEFDIRASCLSVDFGRKSTLPPKLD